MTFWYQCAFIELVTLGQIAGNVWYIIMSFILPRKHLSAGININLSQTHFTNFWSPCCSFIPTCTRTYLVVFVRKLSAFSQQCFSLFNRIFACLVFWLFTSLPTVHLVLFRRSVTIVHMQCSHLRQKLNDNCRIYFILVFEVPCVHNIFPFLFTKCIFRVLFTTSRVKFDTQEL